MKRILLSLLLFNSSLCLAQIYKCEVNGVNTFSDQPCSKTAEVISVNAGKSTPQNSSTLINQCLKHVKAAKSWKDPESVKVVSHFKRWENDDSGARQLLVLEVKAKNGFGAYDGTQFEYCFLDHNGTGLSKIQYFIRN